MTFYNYPPGPMTGRGGPNDDGCPCAKCPALAPGGMCDCDLETVDDDDEIVIFHDPICKFCGRCREHCRCYDGDDDAAVEAAADVEVGDILDALSPERETLEWDTGADIAPFPRHAPIRRLGDNYWVTRDLEQPFPGDEGIYFSDQQLADQIPPKICPNQHMAHFKPTVGTHVCRQCGMIYIGNTDQWIMPSR